MPNIGPLEVLVVLIIALVVFGPKRLPELGRSLGKGIREFRGSISGDHEDEDADTDTDTDTEDRVPELERAKPPAKGEGEAAETVEGEVVADKRS
ncbi:MAG: Sec-independent protein translocase subunit TatA/TatB [Solirubrobacterales bacterium]